MELSIGGIITNPNEMTEAALDLYTKALLLENFSKVVLANIITGEYTVCKRDNLLNEEGYNDLSDIYAYVRKLVTDGLILPEYAEACLRYTDPEFVKRKAFSGARRIVQSYKRNTKFGLKWITFAIIVPSECTPENPWALFTWREADTDTTTMVDALSTLSALYIKILKINLTTDSYDIVKTEECEREQLKGRISGISQWWKSFEEAGNVHEDDIETYRSFTDVERLKTIFKENRSKLSCRYRRNSPFGYRWVQMDLVPSIEYTDDNQVLILYVKDVHEEHMSEMKSRQELVSLYKRDALTMLYNRHKYQEDVEYLEKSGRDKLTCLYIDVNGLHEMNNLLGHRAGDDMLCAVADALKKYFPDERVYRIGGDEFIVLSGNLSKKSVTHLTGDVKRELMKDNYEISAGVESISGGNMTVENMIGSAELAMRADKERFYRENGSARRKRAINEELEKMLAEKRDEEYFLGIIANAFSGVYFVNLDKDTLRHIYIPDYFRELLQKTDYCYSDALKLYIDRFVDPAHIEKFASVVDYTRLKENLRRAGTVNISYRKVNGTEMTLKIIGHDAPSKAEDSETVWIFSEVSRTI